MAEQLIVSSAVHSFMQSADTNAMKTLVVDGALQLNLGTGGSITSTNGVHTGQNGVITGENGVHMGSGGTASGAHAVHMGDGGSADGGGAVHMGYQGTASGTFSLCTGGNGTASGILAVHMGSWGEATTNNSVHMGISGSADKVGQVAFGGGVPDGTDAVGTRQFSVVQMLGAESSFLNTLTLLDATNFAFAADKLYSLQVDLIGIATGWHHSSKYSASFVNAAGTTSQLGTTTVLSTESTGSNSPTVAITNNLNNLNINCTPYNSQATKWYAVLQVTEHVL